MSRMSTSSQQPRRQSRGGESRPPHPQAPPPQVDSARWQPSPTTAIPSIETSNHVSKSSETPVQSPNLAPAKANAFRVPESPRPVGNESHKAAKVAIPRLKRSMEAVGDLPARSGGKHRVNHACEPCRHRKTKCSGERPACRHCQDFKIACYYADGKRDRVKKQFGTMTEKVAEYEKLLKELATRVSDADAELIRTVLDKETYDVDDSAIETMTIPSIEERLDEDESGGESEASAGAGSTGALDRTDEDFTRDTAKGTGFMGKNSEITWLQRLGQENKSGQDEQKPVQSSADKSSPSDSNRKSTDPSAQLFDAEHSLSVADMSYHLDDLSITTFDAVDPYEYPTQDTCQHLFDAFMTRVHPSFPIVGKINLSAQFQKFVSGQVQRPPEKWLAIINLIFAIGAKYSHLIQADWKGDERDHLIYFTRARLLGVTNETLFQHPDLQSIQILGLMAFYFLCTSQINRAWSLAGISIRLATALGLNMRNDSTSLKNPLKEIRYRVWWALYTLEQRLCSMTGRVNCILDDHVTTPLPAPLEEDHFETVEGNSLLSKERQQGDRAPYSNPHSPSNASHSSSSASRSRSQTKATGSRSPSTLNTGGNMEWARDSSPTSALYFLHLVQLTRFTQNIFHQLYNPSAIDGTWSDIQSKISQLDEQLESWYRTLPSIFDFRRNQRDRDFYEYRLSLGFCYYGTKTMIHRPCLCRLDRKIPHQSPQSLNFNRQAAMACVDAARDMLRLIPDEPNAIGLISVGPWWSILHWIVQAATVLMLEISFRAHHMPEEADAILDASKKALRWLHALGEDNLSARRAWTLCNDLLHRAVAKIGRDVNDIPKKAPGRSSVASSSGDASMPGSTPAKPSAANIYNPAVSMPGDYGYSNLDQLMQYDQYFPFDHTMNHSINNNMTDGMQYAQPSSAELEFMSNAYHDDQGHQQQQQQQQQHMALHGGGLGSGWGRGMGSGKVQVNGATAGGSTQPGQRMRYN